MKNNTKHSLSPKSQIEIDANIKNLVSDIKINTVEDLLKLRDKLMSSLETRPYNNQTQEHEKKIRWKRTASKILKDGFVYQGKACTDIVVSFLALCKAKKLKTRFVKLRSNSSTHSIAEIKLQDDWFTFDVSQKNSIPQKGEIKKDNPNLWGKGNDSWDLGLTEYNSIKKMGGQKRK